MWPRASVIMRSGQHSPRPVKLCRTVWMLVKRCGLPLRCIRRIRPFSLRSRIFMSRVTGLYLRGVGLSGTDKKRLECNPRVGLDQRCIGSVPTVKSRYHRSSEADAGVPDQPADSRGGGLCAGRILLSYTYKLCSARSGRSAASHRPPPAGGAVAPVTASPPLFASAGRRSAACGRDSAWGVPPPGWRPLRGQVSQADPATGGRGGASASAAAQASSASVSSRR